MVLMPVCRPLFLDYYDGACLRWLKGQESSRSAVDTEVAAALSGNTYFNFHHHQSFYQGCCGWVYKQIPQHKHVTPTPYRTAHLPGKQNVFGKSVVSSYDFGKSKLTVGIACDFLGNWVSRRSSQNNTPKHVVFRKKILKWAGTTISKQHVGNRCKCRLPLYG